MKSHRSKYEAMSPLRLHRIAILREGINTVAARAGVTPSTISMVERGLRASKQSELRLAVAYRMTLAEFRKLRGIA